MPRLGLTRSACKSAPCRASFSSLGRGQEGGPLEANDLLGWALSPKKSPPDRLTSKLSSVFRKVGGARCPDPPSLTSQIEAIACSLYGGHSSPPSPSPERTPLCQNACLVHCGTLMTYWVHIGRLFAVRTPPTVCNASQAPVSKGSARDRHTSNAQDSGPPVRNAIFQQQGRGALPLFSPPDCHPLWALARGGGAGDRGQRLRGDAAVHDRLHLRGAGRAPRPRDGAAGEVLLLNALLLCT